MESHLGDASFAETDRGNFRFEDLSENHTVWLTELKDLGKEIAGSAKCS